MPNAHFDNFVIETPKGKRHFINAVNAYPPFNHNIQWYRQFKNIIKIEASAFLLTPTEFLRILKKRGYKIYWRIQNDQAK